MKAHSKIKKALSASLSITLAYLFPLYFGIEDTSTAAITVMVIASADSVGSSLQKGIYRVIGTYIGAVMGITLIALFPQDRFLYLGVLSVLVSALLYLARAYRADKTIFLLSAMTMMIVFDGGKVDDIFLYAINKTILTVIGIVIYTFVSVYILPIRGKKEKTENFFEFVWFDKEDIKGTFISFLVFWFSVYLWMEFEIVYGYYIIILATSLSLYTTYSVAKGSTLIFVYTFSFVFAIFSYIFILPNIHGWWSLSIFLFLYSFVGFYFINQKITLFYLLGMATFLIENEMNFEFEIFLYVLFIFYLFLLVLLVFDFFPFNQKSEYMFLKLKERFLHLLKHPNPNQTHLRETLKKMQFYSAKIDYDYFGIKKEDIMSYCQEAQRVLTTKDAKKLYNTKIDFEKLKESKF